MITDEIDCVNQDANRYMPLAEAAEMVSPYRTAIALRKALEQGRIRSLSVQHGEKKRRTWLVDTQSSTYCEWVRKAEHMREQQDANRQAIEEICKAKNVIEDLTRRVHELEEENHLLEAALKSSKEAEGTLWNRASDLQARYDSMRYAYDQLIKALKSGSSLPMAGIVKSGYSTTLTAQPCDKH